MDAGFGKIFDQDTDDLILQQEGLEASAKRGLTLGNYQEIRIRHFEQAIDQSEKQMRETVAAWPARTYNATIFIDHDTMGTKDIRVQAACTIKGDPLSVDLTGTDDRQELIFPRYPGHTNLAALCFVDDHRQNHLAGKQQFSEP